MRSAGLLTLLLAGLMLGPTAARADEATEEAERAAAEKVVALLGKGDYAGGAALAEETFRGWRERYAGARKRRVPPATTGPAGVKYRRPPSEAAKAGAKAIVEAVYTVTDPKAVEHLVKIRTPELALYTSAAVMNIGVKMCEKGKVVEGVKTVLAGCEAKRKRQIVINTLKMSYPRLLGYRLPPSPLGDLQAALTGKDPAALAQAYRLIGPGQDKQDLTNTILLASFTWTPKPGEDPGRGLAVLAAALKDKRPTRRRMAAKLLHTRYERQPACRDRAVALLKKALDDDDSEVRFHAAVSLIRWADPAGIDMLMILRRPRTFPPTGYPVEAIGAMGVRGATRWIMQLADRYPTCRAACLRALWQLRDPAAIAFLGKVVTTDAERTSSRALAASALAATMSDDAFPYMKAALKKARPALKAHILLLMSEFRPELSLPIMVEDMEQRGLFGEKPPPDEKKGTAWLRLRFCTGFADPAAQYQQDKSKLQAAMEAYWRGKHQRRKLADQIRHHLHVKPDPKKVGALNQQMEKLAREVPSSCFRGFW